MGAAGKSTLVAGLIERSLIIIIVGQTGAPKQATNAASHPLDLPAPKVDGKVVIELKHHDEKM